MTEEKTKEKSTETSFRPWFYLFGLAFVALLLYYGTITVYSAHALICMVFVRQMSLIYHEDVKGTALRVELDELSERMDKIDPYNEA